MQLQTTARKRPLSVVRGDSSQSLSVRIVVAMPATVTSTETSTPASGRWTIIGLLIVGVIIAYVARSNISVAVVLPEFRQAFSSGRREPRHAELGVFLVLRLSANSGRLDRRPLRREVSVRLRLLRLEPGLRGDGARVGRWRR